MKENLCTLAIQRRSGGRRKINACFLLRCMKKLARNNILRTKKLYLLALSFGYGL